MKNDLVTRIRVPYARENYFSGNQMLLIQAFLNKKFKDNECIYFITYKKFINSINCNLSNVYVDIRKNDGINQLNNFIKFGTLTINGLSYKCAFESDESFIISKIIITERIYNVFSAIVPNILKNENV